jgi:hypothetical protein
MQLKTFVEMIMYPVTSHQRVDGELFDVYDGSLWTEFARPFITQDPRFLVFGLYTDGFKLWDKSGREGQIGQYGLWPIFLTCCNLPPYYRSRPRALWLLGLVSGPRMCSLKHYMSIAAKEFSELFETCVEVSTWSLDLSRREQVNIKAMLLYAAADYRAIHKVTGHLQHPSPCGCHLCWLLGRRENKLNTTIYGQAHRFLLPSIRQHNEFRVCFPF